MQSARAAPPAPFDDCTRSAQSERGPKQDSKLQLPSASEKPVKPRQIKIHDRIAEQHSHKIKRANQRSPRTTPASAPRQPKISNVRSKNRQRHNHFRIRKRISPAQPVLPDKSERNSKSKR